jgi:Domain of unknown function (DUF4276)
VRHLHILCEGQTEEIIARDVIAPHFSATDIWVSWSIFTTKRPAGGPAFKGWLSRWPRLERELRRLLQDTSTTVLTTMFDYYAFPADAPGMADRPHRSPYDRVRHVESTLVKAIDDKRFLPNLVLHEIDAWVLADCSRLGQVMGDGDPAVELERIVRLESGPDSVGVRPGTGRRRRRYRSVKADHERLPTVHEDDRRPSGHRGRRLGLHPALLPAHGRLAARDRGKTVTLGGNSTDAAPNG